MMPLLWLVQFIMQLKGMGSAHGLVDETQHKINISTSPTQCYGNNMATQNFDIIDAEMRRIGVTAQV